MSANPPTNLEEAIRQSGEGWIIDHLGPPAEAIDHIRQTLEAVNRRARERLGENAPDLSESSIINECMRNPQLVRGFFQALRGTRTPDMLLMVWRIIQGMVIKEAQLSYRRQTTFEVRVVLESPFGGEDEPYVSSNIHDFSLLRHIEYYEIAGRPILDGFYPLRIREMELMPTPKP